jgi:neutral ceramidase
MDGLHAGAAVADITPTDAQFLFGYPYVNRRSTGVNDRIVSSALYLTDGRTPVMFIANDIIFVTREMTQRIRRVVFEATGVPPSHIVVTATHTHSAPKTVDYLSNADDACVPPVDTAYLAFLEQQATSAAVAAYRNARPARAGLAVGDATGVGTNRRDPMGPADPEAAVLVVKGRDNDETIAAMLVYSMHPTVLREDSTVVSADFPGMTRRYLQRSVFHDNIPVLHHTGPAGNQSPRHVISGTTVAEAERLGAMLGRAVEAVLPGTTYSEFLPVGCAQSFIDLPARGMPPPEEAERSLEVAAARLAELRNGGAPWQIVRKAEVDWFGAAETLTLARAAKDGRLEATAAACLPAEVQVVTLGPWAYAAWPGELFVEFGLAAKAERPGLYVISLANGELQGYIATEEAAAEGGYEATNCLFAPESGRLFVEETLRLLRAREKTVQYDCCA